MDRLLQVHEFRSRSFRQIPSDNGTKIRSAITEHSPALSADNQQQLYRRSKQEAEGCQLLI